jgi:hypothetical protein
MRTLCHIVAVRHESGVTVARPDNNRSYVIPSEQDGPPEIVAALRHVMDQIEPYLSNCKPLGPPKNLRCMAFIEIYPFRFEYLDPVLEQVREFSLPAEQLLILGEVDSRREKLTLIFSTPYDPTMVNPSIALNSAGSLRTAFA